MLKSILPAAFAVVLGAFPGAAAAASDASATPGIADANPAAMDGDPVVARGKGFEIRRSELNKKLASTKARSPEVELPPEAEIQVTYHLIETQLVFQKATDAEKAEGKKRADERFAEILTLMTPQEFADRLKATRMTADDLRRMLFTEATADLSLARQLGLTLTDAEINTEIKKHFDNSPGAYDEPPKARIRELVLLTTVGYSSSPLPPNRIKLKQKQIYELRQQVRDGADFAALAVQFNEDFMTKNTGGMRTPFAADDVEWGNLAFAMKPNEVSDVITDSDGYRFFQLLEIVPARKVEFAEVADQIKKNLIGAENKRLAPAYLTRLSKEAGVEILDPGLKQAMAIAGSQAGAAPDPQPEKP
jgi:parvulin-like peptidyl-prolyl isomerase